MDWEKYTAEQILKGYDDVGNRLISLFAIDYKALFNEDICLSCKGFNQKFQKYLEKAKIMEANKKNNSGYVLKKMYENIPLGFGSQIFVNNQNITDKYAEELIKNHPRGEDLFEKIPKKTAKPVKKTK